MVERAPTSGPTTAHVRFEVFTYESRAFLRPDEDPIATLPSPDQQRTEPLRNAWLYLFTWRLSKDGDPEELPTLAFELYADQDGRYHSPHQLDGPGQPYLNLTLDDATATKAAWRVFYGCWISPFRVPKQRLPLRTPTGQAKDPEAMRKWLDDRGVLSNAFRWDDLSRDSKRRGSCFVAVARSPLHHALQLASDAIDEGAKDTRRFERTQGPDGKQYDATELRYLHASVTHLLDSRPEMPFKSRLDMTAFRATKAAIQTQDKGLAGIHAAVEAVAQYIEEVPFQELLADMKAAEPEAYGLMAQPLGVICQVLAASPRTVPTAAAFFEKNPEVLDPASYPEAFKTSRRGFKTMVALLRAAADIGIADDASRMRLDNAGRPVLLPDGPYQQLQNAIVKWAKRSLGVEILKGGTSSASFKVLEAMKKGLDLPSLLWLSIVLESINGWSAVRKLGKAGEGEGARAWLAFTSSMVSLSRSIAALIELRLSKAAARAEITDAMKTAVAAWQASDDNPSEMVRRLVEWERRGRPAYDPTTVVSEAGKRALQVESTHPAALARVGRTKLLRNRMGLVGGVVDTFLSGWTAWDEYQVDDLNAAVAMGISALGSALSAAGYLNCLFFNPAIGAVLIAAGEILVLVGTVAYAFCKNTELESWLDHCLWGNSRKSSASGSTKWSRGPLSEYHGDLTKQIMAFDEILFPLELQWRGEPTEGTVFGKDDLCYLEVRCPMLLATGSTLALGIFGETSDGWCQVVRPLGPAQLSHGAIVVRAQGYRRLSAICKIDLYGDGQHVLPHDEFRIAHISPPPSFAHKRREVT